MSFLHWTHFSIMYTSLTSFVTLLCLAVMGAQATPVARANIRDLITLQSNLVEDGSQEALLAVPTEFNGQKIISLAVSLQLGSYIVPSEADSYFKTITSVPSGEFNSTFILKDGALTIPSGDFEGDHISVVNGNEFDTSDFAIIPTVSFHVVSIVSLI